MMHLGKHSSIRPKKIRQDREQAEDLLVERSRDAEASEKASNAGINPLATGRPKAASVYSLSAWPAVKSSRPRKMGRSPVGTSPIAASRPARSLSMWNDSRSR
jgi:hypothetical protein